MATRTTGAIALRPTGNVQGRYLFYRLNTGRALTRNQWTELPMPNEIIDRVHALARGEHANVAGLILGDCHKNPLGDFNDCLNRDDVDDGSWVTDLNGVGDPYAVDHEASVDAIEPATLDPDAQTVGDTADNEIDDSAVVVADPTQHVGYNDPDGTPGDIIELSDVVDPMQNPGTMDVVDAGGEEIINFDNDNNDRILNDIDGLCDDNTDAPQPTNDDGIATAMDNSDADNDRAATEMDQEYGVRSGAYNLRPRRRRDYSHLHTILHSTILTQHGLKKGLQLFGQDGIDAVMKEMKKLDVREVLEPLPVGSLTFEEGSSCVPNVSQVKEKR
jgi:hypothetical protein